MVTTPTFRSDFDGLMSLRINRIMLVCSAYDQFIIDEDGKIEEQLGREYADLALTSPPSFMRVSDGARALEILRTEGKKIDLIITMFNIGGFSPFEFAREAKAISPNTPVVLLTSFSHEVSRRLRTEDLSALDHVFAWQGNAELLIAIIKMIEDEANAPHDILQGGVQAILLIEDSVRFYSAYLPELYNIVLRQTNDFVRESLNTRQRNIRKRSRPKILFAKSYDHAVELYEKYRTNLMGIISDVTFKMEPADNETTERAGIDFCKHVLEKTPMIPVLLQSSDSCWSVEAEHLGVDFLAKGSSTLTEELTRFITRRMAFGRFRFRDPHTGETVAEADNLGELQTAIEGMPAEVLTYYASQHMFSKWLYSRGLFTLAKAVRAMTLGSFTSTEEMRLYLVREIEAHRRAMGQGVVADFDPVTFNKYITFSRSGDGSLGGKARGLAFLGNLLEQHDLYNRWEGVRVTIPRTLVLTTSHFDKFIEENSLAYIISSPLEDAEIIQEFMAARPDTELMENVRVFLSKITRPLAVRSSSKLEDSHYQPFAGIYSTYMVPYTENPEQMLRLVIKAIKAVYASVFYASSRAYIEASGNILAEEKMAIVIQEVCGSETTDAEGKKVFFPTFSGVARSLNFYPIGDEQATDGICNLAMGLGRTVVEGGTTFRFSPAYPKHALQLTSPEIARRDTQRTLFALDMDPNSLRTSTDDGVNLKHIDIQDIRENPHMPFVASTWDMQNMVMSDDPTLKGPKIITFAPILKYDMMPLAEIVGQMLEMGADAMRSPVEIEFAVNMDVATGTAYIFNILQIRPIASAEAAQNVDWKTVTTDGALLSADKALGLGTVEGIRDVIYVRPEAFNASQTSAMAEQVSRLNAELSAANRPYLLIGPGRWGSSDPWLGVPVKWADISGARVIVESGLATFRVDPSQGTHFFQNLTSFGIGYVTLNPEIGDGTYDVERLNAMPAEFESQYVRHVRFDKPLEVIVDGRANRALIK